MKTNMLFGFIYNGRSGEPFNFVAEMRMENHYYSPVVYISPSVFRALCQARNHTLYAVVKKSAFYKHIVSWVNNSSTLPQIK